MGETLESEPFDVGMEETYCDLIPGNPEVIVHVLRNRQPLGTGKRHSTHVSLAKPSCGLQLAKCRTLSGLNQTLEVNRPFDSPIVVQGEQFL